MLPAGQKCSLLAVSQHPLFLILCALCSTYDLLSVQLLSTSPAVVTLTFVLGFLSFVESSGYLQRKPPLDA